jgi:hypothetical protein
MRARIFYALQTGRNNFMEVAYVNIGRYLLDEMIASNKFGVICMTPSRYIIWNKDTFCMWVATVHSMEAPCSAT